MKMTEADFQDFIVQYARLNGWMTYHTFDSRHSAQGFPDLVLVRTGELIFAEVKGPKTPITQAQMTWHGALVSVEFQAQGAVRAFIWRPEDIEQVKEVLKRRR